MIPLLRVVLPIPPSVNRRTIITRRGGYEHPDVTAYKWQCKQAFTQAWRDEAHIIEARKRRCYLSLSLIYFLAKERNKRGKIPFEVRDLDNMAQVPINILKQELLIDDSRITDIVQKKRPVASEAAASLHMHVLAVQLEELAC